MKVVVTASTLLIVFIAFCLYRSRDDELSSRLKNVLSGLVTIEKRHALHNPRVAVGYGACKDIVFEAKDVLEYTGNEIESHLNQHSDVINTYEDLVRSFAYYFKNGAAAERYTDNATLFEELVNQVTKLTNQRSVVGGNAASMARRFALDGFVVLLASTVTPTMVRLFPPTVKIVGDVSNKDDIHLIFEYKAEEKWGQFVAPRANRFILHRDHHNPRITSLEEFGMSMKQFEPHLLVISGLQMMDNYYPISPRIRERRLLSVGEQMKSQSKNTKVHFEMASITEKEFLLQIFDHVVPFANSLGMNEQELANIYSILVHQKVSLAVNSNPKISLVLDQMRSIFSKLEEHRNITYQSRPLTRLHVHTLAYQLVMVRHNSNWRHTNIAAAKASLVANRYVCDTAQVDIYRSTLVVDRSFRTSSIPGSERIFFDDEEPVACWNEINYHICVAPNLVCTNAKQTAGCGDNISAAGLAAHF